MSADLIPKDDRSWWNMLDAPRDGTVIQILVHGYSENAIRRGFHYVHPFPYPVRWHEGRWCFARHNGPLFPWQTPRGWRPVP